MTDKPRYRYNYKNHKWDKMFNITLWDGNDPHVNTDAEFYRDGYRYE